MNIFKYEMGAVVKHRNTEFIGTIICRAEYPTHYTYLVQAAGLANGKIVQHWCDEHELN